MAVETGQIGASDKRRVFKGKNGGAFRPGRVFLLIQRAFHG
jgi:hypothetical protein